MYFKNISWLALEKVIKLISMFVTSIILSRALGVFDFGLYNFIISITLLVSPFVMYGFDEYCFQKFITIKSKKYLEKLINTCVSIRLLLSLLAISLSLIMYLFSYSDKIIYFIIAISHLTLSSLSIFQIYNNAKLKSIINAKVNLAVMILMIGIRFLLFKLNVGLEIYLFTYSLELMIIGIMSYKTYPGNVRIDFDFKFFFMISKKVLPLMASSLAIVVYYKIDQMMLGFMVGFDAVGIYSIQAQVVLAVNLFLQIIINGTFPAWFENGVIKDNLLIGVYKISIWFSLISITVSFFYSELFIDIFWGKEYIQASEVLIITLFGTIFSGIGFISSKQMIFMKLQYFRMKRVIFGMFINIILNLILIPIIGINGAAIATVIAHVYSGVLGNAFSIKTRPILSKQLISFKLYKVSEIIYLYRKIRYG
ncbi:oligosaccharide flippase family protein [Aliivibrio logei]|uniref:Polysaccharide biosynthesis protein C-terminal domain-containing protein n=1 Tax=Aliivibrio logei 5S-186 TaxID=626086 RepID=A0ABX3AQM4_ALILO|nr:oligosaccharide flippase family protein [Aliivibrio logei]OEF10077.1 hypothetical protein A1Q5_14065 [Aliivibrio logei 5S-186]